MSSTFTVRRVQMIRAAIAAVAALLITFTVDHSAGVGLGVFAGLAIATGLLFLAAAFFAVGSGGRWPMVLLGAISVAAGALAIVPPLRSTIFFFVLVIGWALTSGLAELLLGLRARRAADATARDSVTVGALTLLLGIVLLLIPAGFRLDYTVDDAGSFTLTGIILAVGALGAWAWIVAVYLAIAALSPRRLPAQTLAPGESSDADDLRQRSAL